MIDNYKTRVVEEYAELYCKKVNLSRFFETEAFTLLEQEEQNLLKEQLSAMTDYLLSLRSRIGRWLVV